MPPHCDSLDGPVVNAARQALDAGDVDIILPFVPAGAEAEVTSMFEETLSVRGDSPRFAVVADRWFFENVVRIHRSGEGAPYTGLKPASLSVGPVIPVAERALETGSADELTSVLSDIVAEQVKLRLDRAMQLTPQPGADVEAHREYVEAMLGLQVWAHKLYLAALASAHGDGHK